VNTALQFVAIAVAIGMASPVAHGQLPVKVEIDNEWVQVSRVRLAPHEKLPLREYAASVVVYLTDAQQTPTATHKAGETAYIGAGERLEENLGANPVEEIIIEFKPGARRPSSAPITRDPVRLDPKYHTADFENDRIRVLRTVLEPHIKSPVHEHPPYVVVYITQLHTTMTLGDGKLVDNIRRKGEVAWREATTHSTENIGDKAVLEIQVELK
jgi:quercetin dioxygenase-like cupin family protein